MRNVFLVILIATLSAASVSADPVGHQKQDPFATTSGKLLPVGSNSPRNPCEAYGPGFAKVDGIGTCVKIGGSVSVGVRGGSR